MYKDMTNVNTNILHKTVFSKYHYAIIAISPKGYEKEDL